jgi:Signal transduction histidine kinase
MNFIQYVKDRAAYIIIYYLSIMFTIVIMQFDRIIEGRDIKLGSWVYALVISSFFIILFLIIDYHRKKGFYTILSSIQKSRGRLDEIFKARGSNEEHTLFIKVLSDSYSAYEEKLVHYRERQKEHLNFINQWVHQMKTPVSVINLTLQNGEFGREQAESIREEADKLSHGLEMALYTARITDFEMDFKIEKVDIISTARSVINEHKKEFIAYSIFPEINGEAGAYVVSDAKWIRFVINQIINNSIKYSKNKDTDRKSVQVHAAENKDAVVLSITDYGVGIPKGDLSRVFNPFFTGTNGRAFSESTGMGMYLSKIICDKLGHKIGIESREGEWTKVTIVFCRGRSLYNLDNMTKL